VVLATEHFGQALVEELLDLVVVEDEARARRPHQALGALEPAERTEEGDRGEAQDLDEEVGLERRADAGGGVEDLAVGLLELVDAGAHQLADGVRHADVADAPRRDPAPVLLLAEQAALLELAHDLEDEEGVAVRLLGDAEAERLRDAARAERVEEQLRQLLGAEAFHLDPLETLEAFELRAPRGRQAGPRRADEEHARIRRRGGEGGEELAALVGSEGKTTQLASS